MKNWKKAIAICASAAAMASMAACGGGSSDGDSSSSKSDKKTIGFVAVGPEGGFRTANENDLKKAFEDAGFDLVYSPTQNNDQQKQIQAFNKFVNDEVDAIVLSATNDSGWDDCWRTRQRPRFRSSPSIVISISRALRPRRPSCPISARPMCGPASRLRNSSIRASRLEPTASFWRSGRPVRRD